MTAGAYILLFFSVMLSGVTYFLFNKTNVYFLKLSLAFTGAFLFAISVLHLMPEVYQNTGASVGVFVLIGFFIQIILEFFSEGIEHGHTHVHKHHTNAFPFTMMIGLCLHSFIEGMPLSQKFADSNSKSLFLGILLHHLPVAFALVSMLIASGISRGKSLFYLAIFALMVPAGSLFSNLIGSGIVPDISKYYDQLMAVVIGIFLHISTTILFEANNDHRFNLYKLATITTGALVAVFIS